MIKTCVIGHPIAHSKSPLIHNHWIAQHKLDGEYGTVDIEPDYLKEGTAMLVKAGYAGFNVTVPHKEAIAALCTQRDEAAAKIGAVNTVKIQDGELLGMNTDAYGFAENIKQNAPWFKFTGRHAFVIGAGGAARAVLYALLKMGCQKVVITNRTRSRAEELAQHFADMGVVEVVDWDQKDAALEGMNLVVNTSTLGMNGQPELEIDLSALGAKALVNDIVYAPLKTRLLQQAEASDRPIVTGIGMLLHQARPAFQTWYGVMPEVDAALEAKILQ